VVDAEGGNKLITDGCWKIWQNESTKQNVGLMWYNLRNQTAPSNSFLTTAKSIKGDAPTAESVFTELSPNENTNKLESNGSWTISGASFSCKANCEY